MLCSSLKIKPIRRFRIREKTCDEPVKSQLEEWQNNQHQILMVATENYPSLVVTYDVETVRYLKWNSPRITQKLIYYHRKIYLAKL